MPYRVTVHGPERASLINLRARAQARAAIESELGIALPAPSGPATGNGGAFTFALGPDEWLLRTPLPDEDEWLRRLAAALAGRPASAVLVSDAYGVLQVAGPDTLDVLVQATGVDLDPETFPTGCVTRTAFAKVSAILHRIDDRPAFDIYVDSSLADYAAKWLEASSGGAASHVAALSPRFPTADAAR